MDTIVVKIGGGEGIDPLASCAEVAELARAGTRVVLVHGGSHETNVVAERLGHPPRWITSPTGHTSRRTDRATLEIFEMVYRGKVNASIVERLQSLGVNAVGLCGMDGRIWEGMRKDSIRAVESGRTVVIRDDYTGTVERVNAGLLVALMDRGHAPVLTPPAFSDGGEAINVDADRAAARTAGALGASALLLLSNVPGLLERYPDESSLVGRVARDGVDRAFDWAQGRMKRKVLAAREALDAGVGRVVIGDARRPNAIRSALAGEGTVFA